MRIGGTQKEDFAGTLENWIALTREVGYCL